MAIAETAVLSPSKALESWLQRVEERMFNQDENLYKCKLIFLFTAQCI